MDGVPFLPEEFGGPQKEPRAHLPPHDIRPLIDQYRQIAVGLHPLGISCTNDRLAGGPNDQRLVEFSCRHQPASRFSLQAMMRHHSAFLRKALNMLRLFLKETKRDQ